MKSTYMYVYRIANDNNSELYPIRCKNIIFDADIFSTQCKM